MESDSSLTLAFLDSASVAVDVMPRLYTPSDWLPQSALLKEEIR